MCQVSIANTVMVLVNNTFNVNNVFIATDQIGSSSRDNDNDIIIIITHEELRNNTGHCLHTYEKC